MYYRIDGILPTLSQQWNTPLPGLQKHYDQLCADRDFLESLNRVIQGVPEFSEARFSHVGDLRLYRNLLYLLTRVMKPRVCVETGVHNGMGTAFTLLALRDNDEGTLYSIDLPPTGEEILAQGNRPLPKGKDPGWMIPGSLAARHHLLLGRAQVLLPPLLEKLGQVDLFLHDSDHRYEHMMFEMGLAWQYIRPGGWLVADNVELNPSFYHFAQGIGCPGYVITTVEDPGDVWRTGLIQKPG
jgi:predicted O-methyltransferase YrrM